MKFISDLQKLSVMNFSSIYHFLYFLCLGIGIGICIASNALTGISYIVSLALISPIVWVSREALFYQAPLIPIICIIAVGIFCGYFRTSQVIYAVHTVQIPVQIQAYVISCTPHSTPQAKTQLVIRTIDNKVTILCWATDRLLLYPDDYISINHIQHVPLDIKSSYGNYVLAQNCMASLRVTRNNIKLLNRPLHSISRTIAHMRTKLLYRSMADLSSKTQALIAALFWGKSGHIALITHSESTQFQQWGISHYLARSGLHVYILTEALAWALYYIPLGASIKNFFIFLILALYSILSWTSLSFMRAFCAYNITILARHQKSPVSGIYIIILITTLVLLYNPFYLFTFEFQMSFGLTFALVWWYHLMRTATLYNY